MKKHLMIFIVIAMGCVVTARAQFSGGDGGEYNPYIITTAAELAQLATFVNSGDTRYNDKYYKLGNDIDLSGYGSTFNDGKGWIPIGNYDNFFKGNFDGDNYAVMQLYINDETLDDAGLFGSVDNGTIKNFKVENVNINAYNNIGALVGSIYYNSYVTGCYSTGRISGRNSSSGRSDAGGLIGYAGYRTDTIGPFGNIENCYSSCDVTATGANVGGVVGLSSYLDIIYCNSSGNISGETQIGGIAGYANGVDILESYSTGYIVSNSYSTAYNNSRAGGIAGYSWSGSITMCYSTGDIKNNDYISEFAQAGGIIGAGRTKISNCYSTGDISSSSVNYSRVGGIAGEFSNNTISNCYSTGSISSSADLSYTGGIVGFLGTSGSISNCVALNPSVTCTYSFGRVAGYYYHACGPSSGNIAFADMINPSGGTVWNNIGTADRDGLDISVLEINSDGTFGGRFTSDNGWITKGGKLPGFNAPVDMPEHLRLGSGIGSLTLHNITPLKAWTNADMLYIGDLTAGETYRIYTVSGVMVYQAVAMANTEMWRTGRNISKSIYIIQQGNRSVKTML